MANVIPVRVVSAKRVKGEISSSEVAQLGLLLIVDKLFSALPQRLYVDKYRFPALLVVRDNNLEWQVTHADVPPAWSMASGKYPQRRRSQNVATCPCVFQVLFGF